MSTSRPVHRIERLTDRLSAEMDRRITMLATGLKGNSPDPPFTKRLTEDEQIEQYAAMDAEKWAAMLQTRGMKEARDYSEAMQKLLDKKYGPIVPEIVLVPEGMLANGGRPPMPEPPQQMGPPRTPLVAGAGLPELSGFQGPDVSAQADQIVQGVLRKVGVGVNGPPPMAR